MKKWIVGVLVSFMMLVPVTAASAVIVPLPTITLPGVTVTVPGPTIRIPGPTVTVEVPGDPVTVTAPGVPGGVRTVTTTETVTSQPNPGVPSTITQTIPGQTDVSTGPGSTTTVTVGPSGGPVPPPSGTMDTNEDDSVLEDVTEVTQEAVVPLGLVLLGGLLVLVALYLAYRRGLDKGETRLAQFLRGVINRR